MFRRGRSYSPHDCASRQGEDAPLRPWERWVKLAHLLLLAGVLVLAMAASDWRP